MNEPESAVAPKAILLVDDQPEVREVIKVLLEIDGHRVTEAADGVQGLELFKTGSFDLVVTDYFMPRMRGDEMAARIKELAPSQPILMITGSAEKSGGLAPAADALLCKPFTLDALRQIVAQLLSPVAA